MSYVDPGRRSSLRIIAVVTLFVILAWGASIVLISNALSGPFTKEQWASRAAIWIGSPALIAAASMLLGRHLLSEHKVRAGRIFVCAPLVILAVLALWMMLFG